MSTSLAFVGDLHGNLPALQGIRDILQPISGLEFVFLGDYINKGEESAQVLEQLISMRKEGQATLLRGNHESALIDALDTSDLTAFIKMGGALTIRSYLNRPVKANVDRDFRENFPAHHLAELRAMPMVWQSDLVVAQHVPHEASDERFIVSAHVHVGATPRISERRAQIDTGCGEPNGRLTAFLWPSREYVQVDSSGKQLN